MSFELIRARGLLLAVAFLIIGMLAFTAVQTAPAGAAATAATVSKSKQAKKKAAKKKAAKKRAAKKRKAAKKRAAKKKARQARRIAGLKFYKPPAKLPARHGKLIWQRKAGGLVPLKAASSTRLVLYSSKTVAGERVAVSGSVSIPKGKTRRAAGP